MAIMGMLGAVIVACLAGGIRVWERARSFGRIEGSALIALEEMEGDLRNMIRFRAIPFKGTYNSMSFCNIIKYTSMGEIDAEDRMGAVKYLQPSTDAGLIKKEWIYTKAYPVDEPPDFAGDDILSSLKSLELSFYKEGGGDAAKGGIWTDYWNNKTNYPARVHIKLVCNREKDELLTIERTVLIPIRAFEGDK